MVSDEGVYVVAGDVQVSVRWPFIVVSSLQQYPQWHVGWSN
jgi:hypothetical protein